MKPRKTPRSNFVYSLPGGTEDNDLHCERVPPNEVRSDWELTDDERRIIAAGGRIQLAIYGEPIPPVSLVTVAPFCEACKAEEELVWIETEKLISNRPLPVEVRDSGGVWVYACKTCEGEEISGLDGVSPQERP